MRIDRDAARQLMANLRRVDIPLATRIISHDMDVIRDADIVDRLQEGRIAGSGRSAVAAALIR